MFRLFSSDCSEMWAYVLCSDVSNTFNCTLCWCHQRKKKIFKWSLTKGECKYKTVWPVMGSGDQILQEWNHHKSCYSLSWKWKKKQKKKPFLIGNLPVTRRTQCSLGIFHTVMDSPSDMTHWYSLTAMTVFLPTALTLGRFPGHLYASVHCSTCGMF